MGKSISPINILDGADILDKLTPFNWAPGYLLSKNITEYDQHLKGEVIHKNRVLVFELLELDPNHLRTYPPNKKKYERCMTALGLATSLKTLVQVERSLSREDLYSLATANAKQGVLDALARLVSPDDFYNTETSDAGEEPTTSSVSSLFDQSIISLGNTLASDITSFLNAGNLVASTLFFIQGEIQQLSDVINAATYGISGLSDILNTIASTLFVDGDSILSDAIQAYLTLNSLTTDISTVTSLCTSVLSQPVRGLISDESVYSNYAFGKTDVFGYTLQAQFGSDISSNASQQFANVAASTLGTQAATDIGNILGNYVVSTIRQSNMFLPGHNDLCSNLSAQVTLEVTKQVNQAIDQVAFEIIDSSNGIIKRPDSKPLNYLINLQKYLRQIGAENARGSIQPDVIQSNTILLASYLNDSTDLNGTYNYLSKALGDVSGTVC